MRLFRYMSGAEYAKLVDGQIIRPIRVWNRITGFSAKSFRGLAFFNGDDFDIAVNALDGVIGIPEYLVEVETDEVGTRFSGRYLDSSEWWEDSIVYMDEVDFPAYSCYSHRVVAVWRVDGALNNLFEIPCPTTAADEIAV